MFTNLADFSMVRTASQAIGFYFAYLALFLVLGALVGLAAAMVLAGEDTAATALNVQGIAGVLAGLASSYIAYSVLKAKQMLRNFSAIVLIVVSAALGMIGGGIFGLIIPAYLTTREIVH